MKSFIYHRTLSWISGLPVIALVACATAQPPRELLEARTAYQHAEEGPAAKLAPAELHVARTSLDAAEKSYRDSPGSQDTADTAYVALRKAQRAEALGEAAVAAGEKERADREVGKTQQEMLSTDEAELRDTRGELDHERTKVATARAETAAEHAARQAAEQKSQDAMDALSKSLTTKHDDRGTIITLSSGLLFATGKATLLPGAQVQLNQVADALKTQAEHHFVVGGHTDTQGTDQINDALSLQRANAVRDYLIVRGVSADAITAQGFGSHQPIADNLTAEGRAMNRRVEIIVGKDTATAAR